MTITSLYRVDISAVGMGGAAPADGFIDNTKIEDYMAAGSVPTTLVQSLAKERANMRFQRVRESVDLLGNCYFTNFTATGANSTAAATTFSVTVECEHGDQILTTADESNAGQPLSGIPALKRTVARAMISNVVQNRTYYDPTTSGTTGNATNAVRDPAKLASVTAERLVASLSGAEAVITITKLTT